MTGIPLLWSTKEHLYKADSVAWNSSFFEWILLERYLWCQSQEAQMGKLAFDIGGAEEEGRGDVLHVRLLVAIR